MMHVWDVEHKKMNLEPGDLFTFADTVDVFEHCDVFTQKRWFDSDEILLFLGIYTKKYSSAADIVSGIFLYQNVKYQLPLFVLKKSDCGENLYDSCIGNINRKIIKIST